MLSSLEPNSSGGMMGFRVRRAKSRLVQFLLQRTSASDLTKSELLLLVDLLSAALLVHDATPDFGEEIFSR